MIRVRGVGVGVVGRRRRVIDEEREMVECIG
jgi:hypothetical protein